MTFKGFPMVTKIKKHPLGLTQSNNLDLTGLFIIITLSICPCMRGDDQM